MDTMTVKKAIKGSKEAFGDIINDVKDQAYKIAYCYLHNEQDAMDSVCSGIEKSFVKIKWLRYPEYFKTWFIRIVINECKSELKKKNINLSFINSMDNDVNTSESANTDLRIMIASLEKIERSIIYMKFFSGYTLDEIGKILSLPPGTIRSKLYRSLKLLRKEFSI